MVQATPFWRSAGRTFFDQPGQMLTVAGNGLASYPTITREQYRASRSQPAQPEQDEPAQHHQAQGQQAEQKDVAAKCSHRDISAPVEAKVRLRKVGNRTLPFGAKRQQFPARTADAKTAFRCHGLATSRPGKVVSKTAQARTWQLKPKIGIVLGTTRPTRFFRKGGGMAGEHRQAARRRRIRGRRSARLSDAVLRGREIADVSAAEERNLVSPGASRRSNAGKSGVVGNVLQARRQPATHPIAVQV